MLKRLGALVTALGAALVLLLGTAGPAAAHAALVTTDPAQNSVLPQAPAAVTLTFSEGVSLSSDSVRVLSPAGKQVDAGDPGHLDGRTDTARVSLNSGLPNGTYTVAWRAVSEDSHPVGGAFTFSIGAPSATSVSTGALQNARADSLVAAVYGLGRVVAYASFALLAGVAAFVLICWPKGAAVRSVQRLLMTGWIGLLAATVAVLLLRGPYERGSGISVAFDLSLVRSTLEERIGTALSSRLLLLAAGGVFLSLLVGQLGQSDASAPDDAEGTEATEGAAARTGAAGPTGDAEEDELRRLERLAADRPQRDARLGLGIAGLVLATALAATWAAADHAAVGIQVWLALPLGILHLLAMAFWLGGLATLVVGLRNGLPVAAVERFSKLALGAVSALAATGLYQSWRGVGSWGALVDTEYGRLLLVKIGCVVAMVGVAWISRAWVARLRTGAAAEGATEDFAEAEGTAEVTAPVGVGASAGADGADGSPVDPGTADEADDPVRQAQLARQQAARRTASVQRAQDGPPARAGLRRSVLVESAVAVVVLVVTTLLTNSPPGRVAQAATGGSATAPPNSGATGASTAPGKTVELKISYDTGGRTPNARGTATVTLSPASAGPNTVKLSLDDSSGKPAEVPELQLAFTLPDRDLGPLPASLNAEGPGRWSGTAQLPLTGDWVVSVTVRSSDIDQSTEVKSLKIG
ncbi:copper resistance CopC/CopD family protein [Saccharothrix sp. ST-888]|uniref:copper resistance CopC/CopD family protein n=1 Tax=Saccharothrix sp. ST-888 TaxID=1427391 RepID=UPI0005ED3474|nr:FixH family protein [Saccharothrix sp. ST-888]KJK57611.1 ABC transporter [Saccharothrix sp. ST-888]